MLRVDLRDLHQGPVKTVGEVAADDPALEGLGLELVGPVSVRGQLQKTGSGEYLWRGDLHGVVHGECRRCLVDVKRPLDINVDAAVFSADPEALDEPDFYPLSERATHVDLGEVVREELALAAQMHMLLCREDCAGLCPKCGADLNAGPCRCASTSSRPPA
jgi:uncharacterized protein